MNLKFDKVLGKGAEVVVVDPFDTSPVKERFKQYDKLLSEMVIQANEIEITDDASAAQATEMMAQAKKLSNEIDNKLKRGIQYHQDFSNTVKAFVRPYTSSLGRIVNLLKNKYGEWSYRVEMKRREAEKKAQEAADKKQKEIDQAAKKADIAPVTMPKPVLPKKQQPTRTSTGSASTRFKPDWEMIDFAKLPDKYKMVNDKALNAALRAGIRDIPGVKITEKPVVSVRSA